jgi:hypothetical protein
MNPDAHSPRPPDLVVWVVRSESTGQVINAWLKDFDFDANDGAGRLTTTEDRNEAMTFDDVLAIHAYWTTESVVLPLRPDGKPNRPATAYTIEIEQRLVAEPKGTK